MTFYFLNYYSYDSRKHNRYGTELSQYLSADNNPIIYEDLININWGDGVNAYIPCINLPNDDMLGLGKNYLVVVNNNGTIHSRWYVMESGYTMKGQYQITLRRDLISDHLDKVVSTKCMINRGWLLTGDRRIYKPEGFQLNQVKTAQVPIYYGGEGTKNLRFIVAYLAKNRQQPIDLQLTPSKFPVSYTANTLHDWAGYTYVTQPQKKYTGFRYNATVLQRIDNPFFDKFVWGKDSGPTYSDSFPGAGQYWRRTRYKTASELLNDLGGDEFIASLDSLSFAAYPGGTDLSEYDNKYFYEQSTGKYYLIHVRKQNNVQKEPYATVNIGALYSKCYTAFNSLSYMQPINISATTGDWFQVEKYYTYDTLELELVGSSDASSKVTIPINMCPTANASYDIITIPCGKFAYYKGGTEATMVDSTSIAQELAAQLGKQDSSLVYDVQLMPYPPQGSYTLTSSTFRFTDWVNTDNITYNVNVDDGSGNLKCFISAVQTADNILHIDTGLFGETVPPSDPVEFKVARETTMYRLCSPTYDSLYDFNPYDNNGLSEMRAYMTLKPYNPYLLIQPVFNEDGLYGGSYEDNRGLICSNFSMTRTSDRFLQYELNNANYKQIFSRNIESLNKQQKWAQTEAGFGIAAGAMSGMATGAMGGSKFGPSGAIAGGLFGAGVGLAGGIVDLNLTNERFDEQRSMQRDMHYLNIGNIQALPDALTKVGAFTIRTAKQPFLEVYRATVEEQEALRKYITEQGMLYGDIDVMQTVIDNTPTGGYVSGYAIYMDADFDAHEFTELNRELQMGVRWE